MSLFGNNSNYGSYFTCRSLYSNLTQLKLFKFRANVFLPFCTDELLFRYNFKKQITDLTITDRGGKNVLHNLKCFSLTYQSLTNEYDNQVVRFLRKMCNLQDLTLYIQIKERNRLVNGIQLENNVLIYLSKLQTFGFYICTFTSGNHTATSLSNDDNQLTFSNVKFGRAGCSISHINEFDITYNVFSLPFKF
ncbi:unnamed protein product [Rotaria socialis]|uniref:Uncharacterized protein n=2 Tax=Rotaria socialis TaxID=392032 RepID=A0A817LFW6_9BILA|nr:unnamed protein product [Rotaria socialis]CAF3308405.1 unnamed protein product [Rotaria socialis]CAF3668509.1 unnamed protein product [Rotaria socialis]CAF4242199.1 unnamed protein product [Rotaria socialis]CAF4402301.1 unnamed protein product [Rotaria socialis]